MTTSERPGVSRRGVLTAAGAAGSALALPAGTAGAQASFGGWLSNTSNYDGVADKTGQSEVTITVGAEANGGAFGFAPAAVHVDKGTTVVWEWNGKGGGHNVHATEGADFTSETVAEAGFSFEHTFEEAGVVKYQCDPHASLGMKGVVAVGDVDLGGGGGGGTVQPDYGNWFTDSARGGAVGNYDGTTVDRRGQDEVTLTVGAKGNGGNFAFDPPAVWIDPGTTVTWEWNGKGGAHNVVSEAGPAALDSGTPVAEAGTTYEHTFEGAGITTYYCDPHLSLGMKGAVAVGDDIPTKQVGGAPSGGGGGGGIPLPGGNFGAVFLSIVFGAAGLAAAAVLAGEAYHSATSVEPEAGSAAEAAEPVREIGHEEFEPVGTISLVLVYFLILVAMWLFMYFVEFLGNGPTVIG